LDIITTAIINALAWLGDKAIKDSYEEIKRRLLKKHSPSHPANQAIKNLEQKPESTGRRAVLEEELISINVEHDKELRSIAEKLLARLTQLERTELSQKSTQVKQKAGDNAIQIGVAGGDISINGNK
jgi:hypothetical protein